MTKMGRPLLYNNCLDLDMDCELYFESCFFEVDEWGDITDELREKPIPYTITGLALALGTDRATLVRYGKKEDFYNTIKKHKLRVENDYEIALRRKGTAGEIFGLKNFGWKDKTERDLNVSGPVKIGVTHIQENTD